MVSRQLTDTQPQKGTEVPLVAIDLDGTYVTGNTLHLFAKCALQDALQRLNLLKATKILTWLTLRKLRLISHIRMKNALLRTAIPPSTYPSSLPSSPASLLSPESPSTSSDSLPYSPNSLPSTERANFDTKYASLKQKFQQGVQKMLSKEAQSLLKEYESQGYHILLATAASEIYVPWIWSGDYVATPPYSEAECRGEEKRRRVESYAKAHGLIPRVAITDHPDDLPLLRLPSLTARHLLGQLASQ